MLAMKFRILLCFLFFLMTQLCWAKITKDLSVTLPTNKTALNPLTNFVKEVPLMKVVSTGTFPHVSSVHYLRAQVDKNNFQIPIQFEWQNDILLSDTVLIEPNIKTFRALILQHFKSENDTDHGGGLVG